MLPDDDPATLNLTSVDTLLGDFDPRLEDGSFDIAFSISVMEHVPDEKLADCFTDMARVLKPGGRLLHAIDVYLGLTPDEETTRRVASYLDAAHAAGLLLESPRALPAEPAFTTDMISNPDFIMANWNTISPTLRSVREQCQGISLKAVWIKPAAG
ncbi:MAG: SAM-dependent methyltransferase [Phycisphaerales bacterium]